MPDPKKIEEADHEEKLDESTEANEDLDEAFNGEHEDSEVPPAKDHRDTVIPISPD